LPPLTDEWIQRRQAARLFLSDLLPLADQEAGVTLNCYERQQASLLGRQASIFLKKFFKEASIVRAAGALSEQFS